MEFRMEFHPLDVELYQKQNGSDEDNGQDYYDTPIIAEFCVDSDDEAKITAFKNAAARVAFEYVEMANQAFGAEYPQLRNTIPCSGKLVFECSALPFLGGASGDASMVSVSAQFCEEDVFSLMFLIGKESGCIIQDEKGYFHPDGLNMTFNYGSEVYTSFSYIVPRIEKNVVYGWSFSASRNGADAAFYYLLLHTYYGYSDDYIFAQSSSCGIVDVGTPQFRICHDSGCEINIKEIVDDETGAVYGKVNKLTQFFFYPDGNNFSFGTLIEHEMHAILAKTDEAVFYGDIRFENINGAYICGEIQMVLVNAFNCRLVLPPVPSSMDSRSLSNFREQCVLSVSEAIVSAECYHFFYSGTEQEYVVIERGRNNKYICAYNNAEINVNIITSFGYAKGTNHLTTRYNFAVKAVVFNEKTADGEDVKITIQPAASSKERPLIEIIVNSGAGKIFTGCLESLKNSPDFAGHELPSELINELFYVIRDFDSYTKIKDTIIGVGVDKCMAPLVEDTEKQKDEMADKLYDDDGLVRDKSVIASALRFRNEYERTGVIPNIAIVGPAGTGKTTIAKRLANVVFGKDIMNISASDLKAPFVGHNLFQFLNILKDALIQDKVIFIDEAYQLMGDEFGEEVVAIMLPLMTGDRNRFEATVRYNSIELYLGEKKYIDGKEVSEDGYVKLTYLGDDGQPKIKEYHFAPTQPPIWLGGYDNEIRSMISRNQGLYRRLKKLVISTPTTSSLIKQLRRNLKEIITRSANGHETEKAKILYSYFQFDKYDEKVEGGDENAEIMNKALKPVRDFFGWGSQPQNSKYFASYAGVNTFISSCLDSIDFHDELGIQIDEIITSAKKDIKRQLTVVRKNVGSADGADMLNVISDIDTRLDDLTGYESQRAYMGNIINMLVNKSVYDSCHMTIPKGALMEGAPGTGKTFIARAMAGELQERFQKEAPDKRFGFIAVSGTDLCSRPSDYIASIFSAAEEFDSCILFIDEVDSIAKVRDYNPNYEKYLELIRYMDGIEKSSNVFVLAATNAPQNLDPAFVRPGRIDKKLVFDLPDAISREKYAYKVIKDRITMLERKGKYNPESDEVVIKKIASIVARRTPYYTMAKIETVINNAFVVYYQYLDVKTAEAATEVSDMFKKYNFITYDKETKSSANMSIKTENVLKTKNQNLNELYRFIDEEIEVMNVGDSNYTGKEKKFSAAKNDGSCSSTAVHEVGHALVSILNGESPFETITVLPRGDALGYVMPSESRLITKLDYENEICGYMGGRIAEEIVYGKDNISVGATQDMRAATMYARRMVEMWGFSEEFGFMALSTVTGKYLGGTAVSTCSDAYREKCDEAINKLLRKLYEKATGMLSGRKALILSLAKKVFESETMTGKEFIKLYNDEVKRTAKK